MWKGGGGGVEGDVNVHNYDSVVISLLSSLVGAWDGVRVVGE